MAPLRQRMIEDITLTGLSQTTQKQYIQVISEFARQIDCSPDLLDEELVRIYFMDLRDVKKVALGKLHRNIQRCACSLKVPQEWNRPTW